MSPSSPVPGRATASRPLSGAPYPSPTCRYVDLFGFCQKNPNAMDIAIEEAKAMMKQWGSKDPTFLLTNSRLTFNMTMTPDKTSYVTQGPDGVQRLRDGPNIGSYRGLSIINTKQIAMEDGAPPRDILRRRVRTAEYYRIPAIDGVKERNKMYSFYNETKDAWDKFDWETLYNKSIIGHRQNNEGKLIMPESNDDKWELIILRPNIEHNMLGIIMGRGGLEDLGGTLWGQTEVVFFPPFFSFFFPCCPGPSTAPARTLTSRHAVERVRR